MTIEFTLYGTSACHLCEEAEAIIQPLVQLLRLKLNLVDIADDEALEICYGLHIPVLSCANGEHLHWPFNTAEASQFLIRHKN